MKKNILILGIGNYLMADEGLGVHLAESILPSDLPEDTDVLDGGTGGFHLLGIMEQYKHIILIDATLDANKPGSIRFLQPKFSSDYPQAMSTHDIGLKDLISAMQLTNTLPQIHLFVVSIESIQQQGIELTQSIKNILPELKKRVLELAVKITKTLL